MGFYTYCNNKGCGKNNEPLLDLDTNEVICSECNKNISSITSFTKTQMKSLGQIKKKAKANQAFSVECKQCKKHSPPKFIDNKPACIHCDTIFENLSLPFLKILKDHFKIK